MGRVKRVKAGAKFGVHFHAHLMIPCTNTPRLFFCQRQERLGHTDHAAGGVEVVVVNVDSVPADAAFPEPQVRPYPGSYLGPF